MFGTAEQFTGAVMHPALGSQSAVWQGLEELHTLGVKVHCPVVALQKSLVQAFPSLHLLDWLVHPRTGSQMKDPQAVEDPQLT
jgi:hypothetical protein